MCLCVCVSVSVCVCIWSPTSYIHTLHLHSISLACIARYHCTLCGSIQAVQLGSTEVSTGQLLGAAAVAGLLTFAAVAERKAIKRFAQLYSLHCRHYAAVCCPIDHPRLDCFHTTGRQRTCMFTISNSRFPAHVIHGWFVVLHRLYMCILLSLYSMIDAGLQQSQPFGFRKVL